ncbi:Gfo/Idh/MocA family protein [Agrobacterium tumefaciens]|uniref:Gfo/Idh/MocA family protein n=1 Tax=Agrobacterium tumefaciens TaxID=358 RepID=UPI00080FB685|nr:Gfo/Idh/MocA family oxidoreductase [Agrobacterium tumefaciens]NTD89342.1 Gfo/Idh/MocA family oxidoreductase [Agrobacterium tumefaciens]NTD94025.1 Gfo/Idh/MocA family oxidoreductase [Agrobacterium tumefaciens]NTE00189.1 Gfo/Idh/MocA family oxidoreductase [Agrobacterium tumefaciens]NTE12310.1 Gfo/Idh/MocA family oxidoreductase [Agrobacterium tumefaciens]NTE19815.1 Gfo/Idh/MocA family oxidoreductase [Agrobacterium tumefaciens]
MQNIKTCVIVGAGMVAKTHVLACAASPEKIRLKAIVDGGSGRAKALAAEAAKHTGHHVAVYASIEEAARDEDVDFAIIATPPHARADIVGPLARAGKHILLEKPVARNTREAADLVALCRDAGVTLGIIFQHRMRAASQKARELVASGTLGELGLCEISVPWWRTQAYYDEPGRGTLARDGGGVLISQAIHTIDLALSLAGPVARVQAMAATTRFHKMETEDYVSAGLRFKNGAVGSLVASTASFPGAPESILLHFDKASLRLASGLLHVDWRDGRRETFGGAASGTGGGADPMAFTHEWHQGVFDDFVDAISSGRPPVVTGEAALLSHRLIDAIINSAETGKEVELQDE